MSNKIKRLSSPITCFTVLGDCDLDESSSIKATKCYFNPNACSLTTQGKRTVRFALSSTLSIPSTYALQETHVFSHNPDPLPHPEQDTADSSKRSPRDQRTRKRDHNSLSSFSSQEVQHMYYYKSNYEMTVNMGKKGAMETMRKIPLILFCHHFLSLIFRPLQNFRNLLDYFMRKTDQ